MRVFLFALFMALAPQLAAADPPKPSAQPQNSPAAQKTEEATPPVDHSEDANGYQAPCAKGEDQRGSDLCAQWKAADAAAESAQWSYWQMWIGIGGFGIGLITMGAAIAAAVFAKRASDHTKTGSDHAGDAVVEAKNATKIAREIGEAQARAYISVTKAWFENNAKALPKIIIQVRNSGQSPAYDLQAIYRPCTEPINVEPPLKPLKVSSFPLTDMWPAGADELLSFAVHPDDVVDPTGKGAPGKNFAMVELIVEYTTVFDRQRGRVDTDTAVRLFIPNVPKWSPSLEQPKLPRHPVTVMTSFTAGWIHEYRRKVGDGRRVIKKEPESGTS
ncbi:hypothetical protein [Mesorhizobium sp.]|uniref:hypothetical protein n=1 Tax=Mesorhizobium sp. TaxID=1871066 RepID=UPI000FE4F424|nr:hypothetical protein [Mesorhizobium sp.]RWF67239.1 MAG: hypothetical protein EOS47_02915 [Mesorhizobium sp.]TIT42883.1 MAG: hypothetical protein E5W76_08885 [Mesorhizobium sp.]